MMTWSRPNCESSSYRNSVTRLRSNGQNYNQYMIDEDLLIRLEEYKGGFLCELDKHLNCSELSCTSMRTWMDTLP